MILRKVKLIPLLIDLPLSFFLSLSLFREPAAHVQLQDTWSRRPDSTRAKNRHQYFILRFSFRLACFYFIHFLSNSLCLSIFFTFPLIQIWSRSILSTVKHNKKKFGYINLFQVATNISPLIIFTPHYIIISAPKILRKQQFNREFIPLALHKFYIAS